MGAKRVIATAGNVVVPCYLALKKMGFKVTAERRKEQDGIAETWRAEKGDLRLIADEPVSLLALAALDEQRGPDWKASDEQINDFIKRYGE